jgi:glycosyltransferase involved in cell wall biosynthesis
MTIVFIHQNFPAQYLHLVRYLAARRHNKVFFVTQARENEIPRVRKLLYRPDIPQFPNCHPYTSVFDTAVRTGIAVADVCRALRSSGVIPDIVVGHCGWGETLFVKEVFPEVPLLSYFEFFYHCDGADVGFDPEFAPRAEGDGARLQIRNAVNRLSFAACDWGHTATAWQRSLFPAEMQGRITALHEGVDTAHIRPDPNAWIRLARDNVTLTREDEVITYVSRNLEPYRGFHIFMRALPEILRRRPRAHALIVGGDGLSYGEPPPGGGTYRQMLLEETRHSLPLDRVHFFEQVPYTTYLNILQVSSVHVHLTYPFVLSWSFIESLAAGCALVCSRTTPVMEVIRDRENGLLFDFFSTQEMCDRVEEVLDDPDRMQGMRESARQTAVERFDTSRVTLPLWEQLLHGVRDRQFPAEQPPHDGIAVVANQLRRCS